MTLQIYKPSLSQAVQAIIGQNSSIESNALCHPLDPFSPQQHFQHFYPNPTKLDYLQQAKESHNMP